MTLTVKLLPTIPSFYPATVYIAPVVWVSNSRLCVPVIKVGSTPYNNS